MGSNQRLAAPQGASAPPQDGGLIGAVPPAPPPGSVGASMPYMPPSMPSPPPAGNLSGPPGAFSGPQIPPMSPPQTSAVMPPSVGYGGGVTGSFSPATSTGGVGVVGSSPSVGSATASVGYGGSNQAGTQRCPTCGK